jgi:hypothetical protein
VKESQSLLNNQRRPKSSDKPNMLEAKVLKNVQASLPGSVVISSLQRQQIVRASSADRDSNFVSNTHLYQPGFINSNSDLCQPRQTLSTAIRLLIIVSTAPANQVLNTFDMLTVLQVHWNGSLKANKFGQEVN